MYNKFVTIGLIVLVSCANVSVVAQRVMFYSPLIKCNAVCEDLCIARRELAALEPGRRNLVNTCSSGVDKYAGCCDALNLTSTNWIPNYSLFSAGCLNLTEKLMRPSSIQVACNGNDWINQVTFYPDNAACGNQNNKTVLNVGVYGGTSSMYTGEPSSLRMYLMDNSFAMKCYSAPVFDFESYTGGECATRRRDDILGYPLTYGFPAATCSQWEMGGYWYTYTNNGTHVLETESSNVIGDNEGCTNMSDTRITTVYALNNCTNDWFVRSGSPRAAVMSVGAILSSFMVASFI